MVSRTQCGTLYAQGDCRRFGQFRTGHWRRGVWREQPVCKEATRAQSVLAVAHNTRSSGQVRRLRTKREIQEDRGLECNWQAQLTEQWRTGTAAVHGASSASLHTADRLSLSLSPVLLRTLLSLSRSLLLAQTTHNSTISVGLCLSCLAGN